MGTSTNGEISFGIFFEENYEFPWDLEPFNSDIEDWWRVETGWKWEGPEPFTPDGQLSPGVTDNDPLIYSYLDSQSDWLKTHPIPFVEINYQSGEVPAYILAVPSSVKTANRGYPLVFNPMSLRVSEEEIEKLILFCRKYGLEYDTPACWYLSSYWG